jgi:hypothetical protein
MDPVCLGETYISNTNMQYNGNMDNGNHNRGELPFPDNCHPNTFVVYALYFGGSGIQLARTWLNTLDPLIAPRGDLIQR